MFDTNIFNRILKCPAELSKFDGKVIAHATHIQRDEISNTSDTVRRDALNQIFDHVTSAIVPTESFIWGITAWGQGRWGVGDLYMELQADLDNLNKGKANNIQDALIAETSIRGGYILVTEDRDLASITKKHGGQCMSLQELLQKCNT